MLSAGLASGDAVAQSFTNEGTVASAYAYDYDSYTSVSDSTSGFSTAAAASGSITLGSTSASWAWDSAAGSWNAAFNQGSTEISAYSTLASFFSVSSAYELEVTWDISGINDLGGWQLLESDDLSFTLDEIIDGISTVTTFGTSAEAVGLTGSIAVQVVPGKFYQIAFDLFGDSDAVSPGFGSISAQLIPSPTPAALLAIGSGLVLRRRR